MQADRAALEAAIAQLITEHGPVDLLIANAGIGHGTFIEPINKEEIEETIRVNLLGVIYSIPSLPLFLMIPGLLLGGTFLVASGNVLVGVLVFVGSAVVIFANLAMGAVATLIGQFFHRRFGAGRRSSSREPDSRSGDGPVR